MDTVLVEAKGVNGQIELLTDRVRIKRKRTKRIWEVLGELKPMHDKEILLSQISSIQFEKPGKFLNGHIHFALVGGQGAKLGLLQASEDENTVMFSRGQEKGFEELKARIEQQTLLEEQPLAELAKMADLRDKGILTEEEFAAKRKQLLGL